MRYLYLLFFLILASDVSSQEQRYVINGQLEGVLVKNALFFTGDKVLLAKVPIVDRKFSFSIPIKEADSIMQLSSCFVLCTDVDSVERGDFNLSCLVYFEDKVDVVYNASNYRHVVSGGPVNDFCNSFLERESFYNKRTDSLVALIEGEAIAQELKDQKKRVARFICRKMKDSADLVAIKNNPGSVVALHRFSIYPRMRYISLKESKEILASFAANVRNSRSGKALYKMIEGMEQAAAPVYKTAPKLKKGEVMYDFTLEDVNGNKVKGANVFGKYTLIDFWATWCIPCRAETPNLIEAYDKFSARGFNIITVSTDTKAVRELWKAVVKTDKMQQFVNLNDADKTISAQLNIREIPSNYLVDEKGVVVASNLRGAELEKKLTELLGK